MYTYIISIALNYRHTLYTEITYINCLTSSLNIFTGKTLVSNSNIPFAYPFIDGKPYYNSSLFLNKSIDLISTSL